ncbi:tetraacyldisaccharide 4'-kinase [Haloflavibacter putidus]|uniref:Tetraacyldisaccharide 4'-kinase n=1 Tax=Haloflavibacter putidus TaxID=2576776 RepID=A0A507ZAB2_9FLAO|nr:tetraacyldisaccharide 4'-kinase [Haloflavibacter putidus]TQD33631.1 tetraacyldisaccharide 4'-kinase [Haloflavibacter putidus]
MQYLRKLLFPFSLVYGFITGLRNKLYDWNIKKSVSYDFPVICVGNLSTGGTGKSPMVEYLIGLFGKQNQVAVLSRGYKRSTKGFFLLQGTESAQEVGDEPLQFKTNYPEAQVAVHENRQLGIAALRKLNPQPKIILLDDAYQHRKVKAGFNILLTTYQNLYAKDMLLPAGNLREPKSGAKRADFLVVTKCPLSLSKEQQEKIKKKLRLLPEQELFFTGIAYNNLITNGIQEIPLSLFANHFTLVTGIANPKPLVNFLKEQDLVFEHLNYPDHHNFTEKEIAQLQKCGIILTTEKDYMRLKKDIPQENLFYLPIQTKFLDKEEAFRSKLNKLVH